MDFRQFIREINTMGNFLYFEFKKSFFNHSVLIGLIFLLVINIALIYMNYMNEDDTVFSYFTSDLDENQKSWDNYKTLYEKLAGLITAEKAKFVIKENDRLKAIIQDDAYSKEYQSDTYTGYYLRDFAVFNQFIYIPYRYASLYSVNSQAIVEEAKENVQFYKKYLNPYAVKRNEFICNNYVDRKIEAFYDMKPWEKLFSYRFSDLFILLIMLLGLLAIYINEKQTHMDKLLMTARNGRIAMLQIKILAVFLFIALLTIAFSICNLIVFNLLYGLKGHSLPLYAIEAYKDTPLNCSVLWFYILSAILKLLGFFAFGMQIIVLSSLFQHAVFPYALCCIALAGELHISGYLASVEPIKIFLSLLSPFTLVKGNLLYMKLLDLNSGDIYILRASACIIVQIIGIILMFFLISKKLRKA